MKSSRGLTLVELLIVLSVLLIVSSLLVVAFYTLTRKTDLDTSRDNIISTLNIAKNKTLASEGADQYGVYFDDSSSDTSSDPHKYILFQGSSYADASFKETHILPATVEISDVSFGGAGDEVVFNRLEGKTENDGSITIKFSTTGETRTIYVYSSGEISAQSDSISGPGRVFDSRHVHFDLGWSISGATTLKFNFINAGQVEQVSMADYFTPDSFDWEGGFSVNSVNQEFRVHTHQLESTTLLCIHRDRNQGENTEEVYIYIIQSGIEKEIAHYLADANDTVDVGLFGGTKEPQ